VASWQRSERSAIKSSPRDPLTFSRKLLRKSLRSASRVHGQQVCHFENMNLQTDVRPARFSVTSKRAKIRVSAKSQERTSSYSGFRERATFPKYRGKCAWKSVAAIKRGMRPRGPVCSSPKKPSQVLKREHIVALEECRMDRQFEEFANIITSRIFLEPTQDRESPKFRESRALNRL